MSNIEPVLKKRTWNYDIEVYPNFFSVCFKCLKTQERRRFVIFAHPSGNRSKDRNQFRDLIHFLRNEVKNLIGYNNKEYDDTILKHLLVSITQFKDAAAAVIVGNLKKLNDDLIHRERPKRGRRTPKNDYIENLKSRRMFGSFDLMLLFNTVNRVSLKQVAISLRWPLILDLPYAPSHIVQEDEIEPILTYNDNDVDITEALFINRSEVIQHRRDYGKHQGVNVLNLNDTNIAKFVIRKGYAELTGQTPESFTGPSARTYYKQIRLGDCCSNKIRFMSAKYHRVFVDFRNQVVDPNKLDKEVLKDKLKADLKKAKPADYRKIYLQFRKDAGYEKRFEQRVESRYVTHTLGLGGIHSNNRKEILVPQPGYSYIDADVASYYPSIVIQDKLYPAHLGPEFIKVYRDQIYYPRLEAKASGNKGLAEILKIALNSTFGLTLSAYSWLYDPKVALSITVSGQLYLLMLIERIEMYTNCTVVYSNTDGITVKVPDEEKDAFYSICKQWQEYTGFELEYNKFRKMVLRDVNNFLMIVDTDDVKKQLKGKGEFLFDGDIKKGFQFPVIANALQAYYKDGVAPEQYLREVIDVYDFMTAVRTSTERYDVTFTAKRDQENHLLNKTNRWLITKGHPEEGRIWKLARADSKIKNNGTEKKTKHRKPEHLQKGYLVTLANDVPKDVPMKDWHIDYDFYLKHIYDVIRAIPLNKDGSSTKQLTLL